MDNTLKLSTVDVAKRLLGSKLYRQTDTDLFIGTITETEAYLYPDDLANHAAKGKTKRTEPLFAQAGTIYVYLIYGMYYCLNIVTGPQNHAEAVLIRGLRLEKPETKLLNGPGKLCKELHINRELSGKVLGAEGELWIELQNSVDESHIITSPRVGIRASEPWLSAPLRFRLRDL